MTGPRPAHDHSANAERAAARWRATVEAIAAMPGVAARLAAEHTADDRGDCHACRVGWPCTLATLAADVEKIVNGTPQP